MIKKIFILLLFMGVSFSLLGVYKLFASSEIYVDTISNRTLSSKTYNLAKQLGEFSPKISNQILDTMLKNRLEIDDLTSVLALKLMANNYSKLNNPDKAEKQLKTALRICEKINYTKPQIPILIDLAKLHQGIPNLQKSFLYLQTAQKINNELKDTSLKINILQNLAYSYSIQKNNHNAFILLDSALILSLLTENNNLIVKSNLEIGRLYQNLGDTVNSKKYLMAALKVPADSISLETKITIMNSLADHYALFGNYEQAYHYLSAADSIQKANLTLDALATNEYLNQLDSIPTSKQGSGSLSLLLITFALLFGVIGVFWLILRIKKNNANLLAKITSYDLKTTELSAKNLDFEAAFEKEKKKSLLKQHDDLTLISETLPKLSESLELSSQANYLKDVFLAKLSHEVRSPLTTILGFSSLLETELAMMEKPDLYEYASSITQSGQSLTDLLDNIFDLSLINSNRLQLNIAPFDVEKAIADIISKYTTDATQKGIRIITNAEKQASISSDQGLLKRVLAMLVDNAVRFTEKGFVKITTENLTENKSIAISIKDTGVGIDQVYMKDIFEPYRKEKLGYSTRYQGSGLSLPLAFKMIGLLNGSINIESEKGVGTTISIIIPDLTAP